MEEKVLSLLEQDSFSLTIEEIYGRLNLKTTEEFKALVVLMNKLEDQNLVYLSKKHKYSLISRNNFYSGVIDIKEKGFGFIKSTDFESDLYVSKKDVLDANNGDEVLFRLKEDNPNEGVVVKVTKRALKSAVGELISIKNKYYLQNIDSKNNIRIGIDDISYAVIGDIVQVEITKFVNKDKAFGKVIKVIGNKNDVGIDIASIAIDNGFSLTFPDSVIEEVKALNIDLDAEKQKRVDYTADLVITIDGEDAKDLDDAIHLEKLDNGNYLLGVYIADVSFYVTKGSKLDQEAYNRGTSVYLTDRVIPMLPHKLSNDLCSLNELEEKLVIACLMEINNYGEVVSSTINPGIIKSTHRMTYNDCNEILAGNKELIAKYQDIYPMLQEMKELKEILTAMRHRRGSLDFDIPESKIIVDENGKPLDVVIRTRGISEKIIEEFMLIANETVATTIENLDLPFIYRVHDQASLQKLKDFSVILKLSGYNLKLRNKIHPNELQKLLEEITDEDSYLKTMILRMMAKAVYSEENIGHFGLASKCYTHFTSPIRRYPDLIVHRLLRKYLFDYDINSDEVSSLLAEISSIATQSSINERNAIECEYQVEDMKKAEFMEAFIGQEFTGVISSVTSFGLFVMLPNTIEGLIHISDLSDDYYEYVAPLKTLVGTRTGNKYKIGDKIKVQLSSASKKMREINFKVVYNKVRYSHPLTNNGKPKKRNKRYG